MTANYDESNRFLGMLAEVAVKTLNDEQLKHSIRVKNKNEDKPLKKSKNVLNVEQLRKLSDKVLVDSFSELNCDEIRRVFQFKCVLLPQICDVMYESFAAEDRARALMKDHLLDHIRNVEPNFTVETISARNKRVNDSNKMYRKIRCKNNEPALNFEAKHEITLNLNRFTDEICSKSLANREYNSANDSMIVYNPKSNDSDFKPIIIRHEIDLNDGKDFVEDHCYTSLEGPKLKPKPLEKSEENSLNTRKKCLNATKVIATPAFPFIYEPVLPNISQVIEIGSSVQNNKKTYQKLDSDQTISDSVVDELNANTLQLKRLALQYINDIRVKNKGQTDKSSFRCKICADKTFTSPTTLIYHYRSHAGVKPYECSLCKATFTRQHSLNYHTLIHLNKSRFVCDECGRNFRHPSHFKEHMRRHTGETPYECTDCYIKFKTRNTYKRHLQTKHAKMLTSKGIFDLPDSSVHLRKPCPPRRKYGLGFLHQNIEAVARYERAQQEVTQTIRANCHLINAIDSNHLLINNCNKNFNSSKNNFEKLLQAVAIAEDQQTILLQ